MLYSFKNIAASFAAVCLSSGMMFLSGCDDCDDCHHNDSSCASGHCGEEYHPFVSSGTPNYSFSYDTARVEAMRPMEAGSQEFATRYSQEPGMYDMAVRRDVMVFDWSADAGRNVDFALGARPESDREILVSHRQSDRGLRPSELNQPIETSVDNSARIDRETSIGPGAENPDIYRERLDRSRYFSRDDVRDDNMDVDPTFGRGATVRDRSQFDVNVQSRRDAQIYRNTSTGVRSRGTNAGVRSMTSTPGFDTTRDSTSGAGSGMGSGGVSSREYPTSTETETGANSRVGGTEAGDIGVDTRAGVSVQPTARSVQEGTGPSGTGAVIGAGPSGTFVQENVGTPGSGTGGSGTKGTVNPSNQNPNR
jgi:hypothetical protein